MKTPTFKDHRVADEVLDARELRCAARGCPLPWSMHVENQRLCTRHAGRAPAEWPAITEQVLWEQAQHALRRAAVPPPPAPGLLDRYHARPTPEQIEQLRAARDRAVANQVGPRERVRAAWQRLRERERDGKPLTRYQAEAWRAALKLPPDAPASEDDDGFAC